MKRFIVLITLACSMVLQPLSLPVSAVTASDWDAGVIMNDILFTNASVMTVGDIQSFLSSKVASCDTYGSQPSEFGGGTRAQYGAAHANPAPFTCLKDYYEVPKTAPGPGEPESNYGRTDGYRPPGSISAAQMIYNAAQNNNISARVLLVKLATESAGPLTSDDWPFKRQYLYAMGAHCPDSGPGGAANCDVNWSGFSLQIDEAASLMRWYLDSMQESWWQYKRPFQVNNILWRVVESGCGGSNVYINSKATAALYTYTPYQPNAAALNNMYGTGDGCSSYGNRNFWRVYNDWFGSTTGTPFFSNNGMVYITGANNTYYYVPSQELLSAYGFGSRFLSISPVSNTFVASMSYAGNLNWVSDFEGPAIYAISSATKHHFPDEATYSMYGYTFGVQSHLPFSLLASYTESTPMSSILKVTSRPEIYVIENGKKRHIGDYNIFLSSGTPVYSQRPSTTMAQAYAASLRDGQPVLTNDTLITAGSNRYIYYDGVSYPISQTTLSAWSVQFTATYPMIGNESLLNVAPSSLTVFARDSSGVAYILDNQRKFLVGTPQSQAVGLTIPTSFSLTPAQLLAKFSQKNISADLYKGRGNPEVYSAIDGQLYHIPSEPDFFGLGYSLGTINELAPSTIGTFTTSPSKILKQGRLVRVAGTNEVYVINGSQRHHVPSPEFMSNYGFSFGDIYVTNSLASLGRYPGSIALTYFVKDSSNNVWLIDGNKKWSVDAARITEYGINEATIVSLTPTLLSYTTGNGLGALIRGINTPHVYKVENGQKRWITSEQMLANLGYSQSQVQVFSSGFVQSIPNGQNY